MSSKLISLLCKNNNRLTFLSSNKFVLRSLSSSSSSSTTTTTTTTTTTKSPSSSSSSSSSSLPPVPDNFISGDITDNKHNIKLRKIGYGNSDKKVGKNRKKILIKDRREIVMKYRNINEDHEDKAKQKGLGWRIVGSTILHRYPTITPDLEPWEIEMYDLKEKIGDSKREFMMREIGGTEAQFFAEENPTVEEIIESMPFKPAPRVTEADEKNDRRSLERKLPNSLFLVVKRNRANNPWQFPQGKVLDNENSMRSVAERVLDRAGGKFRRWFISNAPIGYYCYEYPEEIQKARNQYGAKVFFYRAQLIAGNIKLETKLYKDYAWVSRDEISEYFDENMSEYIKAILPME